MAKEGSHRWKERRDGGRGTGDGEKEERSSFLDSEKTGKIVEFSLTDERVHESKVFKGLMKGVKGKGLKVEELIMDGAYDREEVWSEVERMGAKAVIKVRREGREKGLIGRDETIREVREKGIEGWAKEKGYGRRNMAEASFSRLKGIFGERVRARSREGQESEIRLTQVATLKDKAKETVQVVTYTILKFRHILWG